MDDDKERDSPAEPEEGLVLVEGGLTYDEELLQEARLRLEALYRERRRSLEARRLDPPEGTSGG